LIDTFTIAAPRRVAHITFVSADACEKYCKQYPNGLTFKYKGRSRTVFVHNGDEVAVVSGVLHGYLECGATRCVRAAGADDEWGMKALQKLAEGKTRKGKVESISRVYRKEVS